MKLSIVQCLIITFWAAVACAVLGMLHMRVPELAYGFCNAWKWALWVIGFNTEWRFVEHGEAAFSLGTAIGGITVAGTVLLALIASIDMSLTLWHKGKVRK